MKSWIPGLLPAVVISPASVGPIVVGGFGAIVVVTPSADYHTSINFYNKVTEGVSHRPPLPHTYLMCLHINLIRSDHRQNTSFIQKMSGKWKEAISCVVILEPTQ